MSEDAVTEEYDELYKTIKKTLAIRPSTTLKELISVTKHYLADYRTILLWANDAKTDFMRAELLTKLPAAEALAKTRAVISQIQQFISEERTATRAEEKLAKYEKKIAAHISLQQVTHAKTVERDIIEVKACIENLKQAQDMLEDYEDILEGLTHDHPIKTKHVARTINSINDLLVALGKLMKEEETQDSQRAAA